MTLAGITFVDDSGDPLSDELFEHNIRQAIDGAEDTFDIVLHQHTVKGERHDLYHNDSPGWFPFNLDRRPLQEITRFEIKLGEFEITEVPVSWATITDRTQSNCHIIPTAESIGAYTGTGPASIQILNMLQNAPFIPGYFRFSYTTGFLCREVTLTIPEGETEVTYTYPFPLLYRPWLKATLTDAQGAANVRARHNTDEVSVTVRTAPAGGDATVTLVIAPPNNLLQWIGIQAALTPLAVAGDLALGAGIAAISKSMDGLSESVQSTASAMYSAYSARIKILLEQGMRVEQILLSKFRPVDVGIF